MTEYELADLAGSYAIGAMTAISLYLTIVSAYLATAFVAGNRLNSSETLIITVLFVCAAVFFIYGTVGFFYRQVYMLEKLASLEADATFFISNKAVMYIAVVQLLGIVASLKFMWGIRRRNSD